MAITTGVVKIGSDGFTHVGKIEKGHLPWYQAVYTKVSGLIVEDNSYIIVPFGFGYPLFDTYTGSVVGGINESISSQNTYVCPLIVKESILEWSDLVDTPFQVEEIVPANLVKILDSEMQPFYANGIDGYSHEVVGFIGYRESRDGSTKEHIIYFGYKTTNPEAWQQVDINDIDTPKIGQTITIYIPTSVEPELMLWSKDLSGNEETKQSQYQEYKVEIIPTEVDQTTGAAALVRVDLRFLPSSSAAMRGDLNGIGVDISLVDKASATSSNDVIVDMASADYPICDVYWNGSAVKSSNLGDLATDDVVRLFCVGKPKNTIRNSPFIISSSKPSVPRK